MADAGSLQPGLAQGVRRRLDATWAMATTGVAVHLIPLLMERGHGAAFAGAAFGVALTSVTTARTLSVTNGIVTSVSSAFGSRAQRARTCT